jgi:hypothetical protein
MINLKHQILNIYHLETDINCKLIYISLYKIIRSARLSLTFFIEWHHVDTLHNVYSYAQPLSHHTRKQDRDVENGRHITYFTWRKEITMSRNGNWYVLLCTGNKYMKKIKKLVYLFKWRWCYITSWIMYLGIHCAYSANILFSIVSRIAIQVTRITMQSNRQLQHTLLRCLCCTWKTNDLLGYKYWSKQFYWIHILIL